MEILGLFPSFDSEVFGGVQASGYEAWNAIKDRFGEAHSDVLFYKNGRSKAAAALAALRLPRAKRILVWHIDLAKLLPLLHRKGGTVTVFLHGVEAWRRQDPLTRVALRNATFLSNTDFTWSNFIAWNPEFAGARHRTVHLGVGSGLTGNSAPCDNPPAAFMIGRLNKAEDYKGHRELIAAWPLVLKSIPNAELWITGDGDLRPSLERFAAKFGVQNHVTFHGFTSETEKERLLERCRCLAMPSTGEGFGLVYLEAMRMGRPCLVSTLDAGREVVNPPESGLAVNPADPAAIVTALTRLLTFGPEWAQWSAQARRSYETRFTREHFRQRLLSALTD
jgi:phosphatidyl-myo-inositol dimannoside synthase